MKEEANETAAKKGTEERDEAVAQLDKRLGNWRTKYESAGNEGRKEMSGFNRVVLMGRLTRDPEIRQIRSGQSVADLGLAVSEFYKNKDGERGERTCFVDVVTWGRQAETCAEYLKKGSPVLVEGRLQLDRWEASDGQKRSKHRVRADRVQFLNGNRKPEEEREPATVAAGVPEDDNMPF